MLQFDGKEIKDDNYDRYIYMSINNEQGQKMYDRAEKLRSNTPDYNLYEFNCNHMAQTILLEADLSFSKMRGNASDEKELLDAPYKIGVWDIISAYRKDREDLTIPNAAYKHGVSIAEDNGWIIGETDWKHETIRTRRGSKEYQHEHNPLEYNPFR
ncbi:MAG TPA: hypothetical protein PKU88_08250 [Bacillota bacterium]|nr:hypothetical protein [Bacillota bacterium]HPB17619.1 hypothetical protein [Clostridia bacterium]HNT04358.1 hypothetical protein [Bacillota bacterium]HPX69304.1 hypothetical protein [Bacillota bacterium]HQA65711.1 hypothetical protein [Bacillota bacterium]